MLEAALLQIEVPSFLSFCVPHRCLSFSASSSPPTLSGFFLPSFSALARAVVLQVAKHAIELMQLL